MVDDDGEDNDNDNNTNNNNNNNNKGEDTLFINDLDGDNAEELNVTDLDLDDPLDIDKLMQLDFEAMDYETIKLVFDALIELLPDKNQDENIVEEKEEEEEEDD
jgi:hypothetical protein